MWKRLFLAVFVLLALEVGLFLIVFPWSDAWEKNVLLTWFPLLRTLSQNSYFRGAVSGLGLWNVLLGFHEALNFKRTLRNLESREAAGETSLTETRP